VEVAPASPNGEDGPWLADAMLGKLARYLRFLGADTLYLQGVSDREIVARANAERRTVITRDRGLARRAPGAVLLRAVALRGQLAEMFARFPGLARSPRFDRCPECNAALGAWRGAPADGPDAAAATAVLERGTPVTQCPECRRYYWDGTHAEHIRRVISEAVAEARPT
jgi:uncharacterized protein